MLKCIACGYEQPTGKFCGDCGTKFKEMTTIQQAYTPTRLRDTRQNAPNAHLQKLIKQVKDYRSYFLRQLKSPALRDASGENEFANGIISMILLGIVMTLSLFASQSQTASNFLSFFGSAFIFCILTMGIPLLTLFLITTFLGPQQSIKTISHLYGAHLPSLIIGTTASLLLFLLKSFTYGNLLLSLLFLLAILLIPLYLLCTLILQNRTTIDPFYMLIFFLMTYSILFAAFIIIITDSAIGGYLTELLYWFY